MAKAATQTRPASFEDILDRAPSENDRPKPLPTGSYVCVVKGLPEHGKSSQKQTPFVKFTLQPLEAMGDVDAEALEDMGGFTNKTVKATYYITEDSIFRLNDFLAHCGIETDGDMTRRQMIEETPGKQVVVTIKHRASEDGQAIFAEVASTAAVE